MNVILICSFIGFFSISSSLPASNVPKSSNLADNSQSKRDLSLSYAATDIGSKDGSRAKTITVIKNISGKKDEPIKVDPKLHKKEDWGSHFRDNFNSYGVIPDVPDIDDLFEYVNKKEDNKPKEKDNPPAKEPEKKDNPPVEPKPELGKEEPKKDDKEEVTVEPSPVEETPKEEEKVEKIAGDAELIQPAGKQGKVKSQSLDLGKYRVRESVDDSNFNLKNSAGHYFSKTIKTNDKYIQSPDVSYNYPQPSLKGLLPPNGYSSQAQSGRGSIPVTTPSGRTFDVPIANTTDDSPYLAPNFRRNQNSLPGVQFPSSSQRPYIAPNLRKTYEVQLNDTTRIPAVNSNCIGAPNANSSRPLPAYNVYRNIPTNIRTDGIVGYKPNIPRSRGLRY